MDPPGEPAFATSAHLEVYPIPAPAFLHDRGAGERPLGAGAAIVEGPWPMTKCADGRKLVDDTVERM